MSREGFIPPADRLISELDGKYYKLSEVAKILGVGTRKLRKLLDDPNIKAPSKQAWMGEMKVFLYSEEDVEELKQYFNAHIWVEDRRGPEGN